MLVAPQRVRTYLAARHEAVAQIFAKGRGKLFAQPEFPLPLQNLYWIRIRDLKSMLWGLAEKIASLKMMTHISAHSLNLNQAFYRLGQQQGFVTCFLRVPQANG